MLLPTSKFQLRVYNKSVSVTFYLSFLSYFLDLSYLVVQLYLSMLNNRINFLRRLLLLLDNLKISLLLSLNEESLAILIRYLQLIYGLITFYLAISSSLLAINLLILFLVIFLDTSSCPVNIYIQIQCAIFAFLFIYNAVIIHRKPQNNLDGLIQVNNFVLYLSDVV